MLWNFFSLSYPCICLFVLWIAMSVLRTRADADIGAGIQKTLGFSFGFWFCKYMYYICLNHVLEIFWKTLSLYKTL